MKKAILTAMLAVFLSMTLATTSIPTLAMPDPTWVWMMGCVNSYGGEPAWGWLGAYAKVPEWGAKGRVFWMPGELGIPPVEPGANFTFSFHAANFSASAQNVELNPEPGINFTAVGIWDVWNYTIVFRTDPWYWEWTKAQWVDDGPGELDVLNVTVVDVPWGVWHHYWKVTGNFTIAIEKVPLIEGTIFHYFVRTFEIPEGDVNYDRVVDIYDLLEVASGFGSTPDDLMVPNFSGMPNYDLDDFSVDLNFDFTIDIYDLIAVAKDFGKEY